MAHSYDDIRAVMIDALAGRIDSTYVGRPTQLSHLRMLAAMGLAKRDGIPVQHGVDPPMDQQDEMATTEVFWDLFRDGLITPGYDTANRDWPFFHLTRLGQRIVAGEPGPHFFHDVSSFERIIKREVPTVDPGTLLYALEAMNAFKSRCIISATVMIGVALEDAVLSMFDAIASNSPWEAVYKKTLNVFHIGPKVVAFRKASEQHIGKWPDEVKEGFDTKFTGVQELIRNYRNDAGHPTEKVIQADECFILLQLFVPSCQKVYQLRDFFKTAPPP